MGFIQTCQVSVGHSLPDLDIDCDELVVVILSKEHTADMTCEDVTA